MDTSKIIIGTVGGGRYTVTAPIVKEDYGLYLKIEGLELPSTYEVDFSNSEHNGTSVTMIGNSDGVLIPSQFIKSGKDVFAFLYHVGADYGRTVFKFRIPNKLRPDRTDETPTPEEQSTIDQAISALNTAVAQTAQDVIDADASAQSASQSAENAHDSAVDAQNYAESASGYASDAQGYATTASQKATEAGNSADRAAQIKTDIEGYVSTAQGYAQTATDKAAQASQSATNASNSATTATTKAGEASASATTASNKASEASGYATTASNKATEASGYANTASQKASDASDSASAALGYKTDAESAKTAAQTAQGLAEDAQEAAESAAASVSASAAQIAQNTADIASLEADRYEAFVTDSASGSIASFPDGADGLPLKSLVVDINPVQDLHGQDSPYPAGGGKNLFDKTATDTSNGYIARTYINGGGTASTENYNVSEYIRIKGSTTYTLNPTTGANPGYCFYDSSKNVISGAKYSDSATVTFTSPSNAAYLRFSIPKANIDAIQLEEGSAATAYAPYENICPISGWTEVGVEQSGVNVWDEEWEVGGISSVNGANTNVVNVIRAKGFTRIKPLTSYYNYFGNTSSGVNFQVRFYNADKNYIGYVSASGTAIGKNTEFVTPSNAHYLRFQVQAEYGTTYNHDISINYPSTDHDYHPYTGRSITIDLGQTVYGGKLDVLTGKLVVDRAMVDLGTLDWTYDASRERFRGMLSATSSASSSNPKARTHCLCSIYETSAVAYNDANRTFMVVCVNTDYVWLRDNRFTDAATFKTAMSGVQLVYELAEPIEIQLDAHTLNSLYGVNNIWADTGDCSVEYRADTKLYIEKLTQPEEDDMIADSAISEGQFFMVGNSLYRALANIASGATITVGTNAQRVSLSDALNLVNA